VTGEEFLDVLNRYPELRAGLAAHADKVVRIARRVLVAEQVWPRPAPDLPVNAPGWERAYWERRRRREREGFAHATRRDGVSASSPRAAETAEVDEAEVERLAREIPPMLREQERNR
jgi:hypothetical protein